MQEVCSRNKCGKYSINGSRENTDIPQISVYKIWVINRKLTWKIKHESIDMKLGGMRTIVVMWNVKDSFCSKS